MGLRDVDDLEDDGEAVNADVDDLEDKQKASE